MYIKHLYVLGRRMKSHLARFNSLSKNMERHVLKMRFGIDDDNLCLLAEDAKDYAFSIGMAMKAHDLPRDARVPTPFCLVPSPFPQKYFDSVKDMQPYLNYILYKVANSKEFLKECLSSILETDEFVQNIFKIFEAVEAEGQLSLGLIRSDYLLNTEAEEITGIKQIENNTIASSFGGLSPLIKDLHVFVLNRLGQKDYEHKLPTNETVLNLAKGLISAWDAYGNANAVILFVIEDTTINICDQRAYEYAVLEYESKLEVIRCNFKDLRTCAVLKGKTLWVKDKEVAVVYYRYGYMPDHYELEDWETRLMMERSKAIKCPSAGLHLAGSKKVQSYLNKPGILERFVDEDIADRIRELFTNQYDLDKGLEGDTAIAKGIENPHAYVLKPEREGGGNNVYDEDVKHLLKTLQTSDERSSYILMDRINAPVIPNCIIRRDEVPEITGIICELGIFGTILGNKDDVFLNNFAGHVLRSKKMNIKECGIAAGFGALDSPYLE